jgi:hypothetical protein
VSLRLVEESCFSSLEEVEQVLSYTKEKTGILLLTETSERIPKVKPGLPALSFRVLDETTAAGGPLDQMLEAFVKQRPRLFYRRLLLDRRDAKVMTTIGACWLPQVRIVKNRKTLFRSSVSIGDNGQFLAQDVGGRSFMRRVDPGPGDLVNLSTALAAELDRPRL